MRLAHYISFGYLLPSSFDVVMGQSRERQENLDSKVCKAKWFIHKVFQIDLRVQVKLKES